MSEPPRINWDASGRQQPLGWLAPLLVGGVLALLCAAGWLGTYALERRAADRRNANEAAAIRALRAITNAQTLYREGDKDGNGVLDYADRLSALVATGPGGDEDLIDPELATGVCAGYVFDLRRAPGLAGQFVWFVSASPRDSSQGMRHWGTSMAGIIFFSSREPIRFDETDGSSPNGCTMSY